MEMGLRWDGIGWDWIVIGMGLGWDLVGWDWEGYKKYSKGERILTDILSYTSSYYCTISGQLYFYHF